MYVSACGYDSLYIVSRFVFADRSFAVLWNSIEFMYLGYVFTCFGGLFEINISCTRYGTYTDDKCSLFMSPCGVVHK